MESRIILVAGSDAARITEEGMFGSAAAVIRGQRPTSTPLNSESALPLPPLSYPAHLLSTTELLSGAMVFTHS